MLMFLLKSFWILACFDVPTIKSTTASDQSAAYGTQDNVFAHFIPQKEVIPCFPCSF